jgi:hypothetical protein
MTGAFLAFQDTVYGVLSTFHPARLLQLNRFVTAGLTPSGDVNGYHRSFRSKIQAAVNTNIITNGTKYYTDTPEHQVSRYLHYLDPSESS